MAAIKSSEGSGARASAAPSGMFASLAGFNFRAWSIGALISNVGTWMQRTAQDWVVLMQLTDRSATAVGIVMALQFAPQVLLLPLTGAAADRLDRRKLLLATQSALGALALGLGLLTMTGLVRLWHLYVFAFLLGCVSAFDAPARQTFVAELVGEDALTNAVALNSTSFNAARLIGPAAAGVLIASIGSGWVFLLNAASFVAVIGSLLMLRQGELHPIHRAAPSRSGLADGLRYVWRRSDMKTVLFMLFLIGTFGLNFPIFISTMAVGTFHKGAGEYGLLTSVMAIGSVAGALFAARRQSPGLVTLFTAAGLFGVGVLVAAIAPSYTLFSVALVFVGVAAQIFTTTSNAFVQISTDPDMRGRVIAILLAIMLGGTPIGAPIVGRIADAFGPRWAMAVGAIAGFAASITGIAYCARSAKKGS